MVSSTTILPAITAVLRSVKFDKTEADFPFIYLYLLDISEIIWALLIITQISNHLYFTDHLCFNHPVICNVVMAKVGWIVFFFLLRVTLYEINNDTLWFIHLSGTMQEICWSGKGLWIQTIVRVFIFNMS